VAEQEGGKEPRPPSPETRGEGRIHTGGADSKKQVPFVFKNYRTLTPKQPLVIKKTKKGKKKPPQTTSISPAWQSSPHPKIFGKIKKAKEKKA